MHSVEDQETFKLFIKEVFGMIKVNKPFLLALKEDPEHLEIEKKVVSGYHQLYHSIKGTSGFFGLDNLVYLAEAYEYLMDQILSGIQILQGQHIILLEKGNSFLEVKLPVIWKTKSDDAIEKEAKELAAETLLSAGKSPEIDPATDSNGSAVAIQPEMLPAFLGETNKLLDFIEQEFVLWDYISIDHARLQELSIVLKRLQSNFSFFEAQGFERLCQVMELTLNRFLGGEVFHGEYPERIFIQCVDLMKDSLADFSPDELASLDIDKYTSLLHGLIRQPVGELLIQAGLVAPETVEEALEIQKGKKAGPPQRIGEVLVEMGEVSNDDVEHILDSQRNQKNSIERLRNELADSKPFFEKRVKDDFPDTVEVKLKTVQQILFLVSQLEKETEPSFSSQTLLELKQRCRVLEKKSVELLVGKVKRFVHELTIERKKTVSFSVVGADLEIDHEFMRDLYFMIVQMVHNVFDHGLENEAERLRKGKKKRCNLKLLFLNKEEELWVSVEDDGRGVDTKKLRNQARDEQLLSADDNHVLTNQEITELIFKLSELQSGRDLQNGFGGFAPVKQYLKKMNGKIAIVTRPDRGTRVTVKIPRSSRKLQ